MNNDELHQLKEILKLVQTSYTQLWVTVMINSITLFIVILHLIKIQNMLR